PCGVGRTGGRRVGGRARVWQGDGSRPGKPPGRTPITKDTMHTRRRLLTLAAAITGTSALAACGADGPDAVGADGPPEGDIGAPDVEEEVDGGMHLSDLDEERRSAWGEGGTAVELTCAQNVPVIGEEFV